MTQWLGESTHFAVSGTFDGKPMNFRLEGDAAKDVKCRRTYNPLPGATPKADGTYDTNQVYLVTSEIGVVIPIDGTPTDVSVGYWRHDVPAGTHVEVIPRIRGSAIPAGKTWVDFQLSEPGSMTPGLEKAAEAGSLEMKLNSGTPDQSGVFIPGGGRTGEFIQINWGPQESLTISATADCQDSQIVTWGSRIVAP